MKKSSSEGRVACPYCQWANLPSARYCRECGRDLDPEGLLSPEEGPDFEDEPTPWWAQRRTAIAVISVLVVVIVTTVIVLLTRGGDAPVRADTPPPPAADPPPPPKPASANSPTGVIRAHWRAIARHDYDRAYNLLSADYRGRVSRTDWVGSHERHAPRVHIGRIRKVKSLGGGQAFVFADIYTRDTGSSGDSSACIRFVGQVRVARRGGAWRYRPGAPGDTFDRTLRPRSDRGCRRLFS